MRICVISKYPPVEGGESSKAYWLARALGARGHEIHIVTNAMEVESDYQERFEVDDLVHYQPANVTVHNTDPFVDPWYIPYTKPYAEKIASYTIEIIREYDLQLIDSWYILPYVVSGFIAKTFTQRPQILRHAGSDMSRLLASPYLHTLFVELFRSVDRIVTYPSTRQRFLDFGIPESRIFLNTKVSVDTTAFNPNVQPADLSQYTERNVEGLPVITYFGKVGVTKGIFELVEVLGQVREDFVLLFVAGGRGMERLKDTVARHGLEEKTIFLGFVPPWRIPSLMRASTCVVHPERDFPVLAHTPILPREVMAVGTCLMLSYELYEKRASDKLIDGESILVVNPKDIEGFKRKLERVIKDPNCARSIGQAGRKVSEEIEDFEGYVEATEELYEEVLNSA